MVIPKVIPRRGEIAVCEGEVVKIAPNDNLGQPWILSETEVILEGDLSS